MDISKLSDEDLLKIVGPQQSSQPSDLGNMSDEDLMKLAGVSSTQPSVTPPVASNSELSTKMTQEKSVKDKAIADAKLIQDPAERDQALRDAMRLGIATSGEVSSDIKAVKEQVGVTGTPATTYEGKTIGLGDVAEPGMVDFTVDLLTSTPTGKVIGAGALSATGLGVYSAVKSSLSETSKGTDYLIKRIVAGLPEEEAVAKTGEIIDLVKSIPKDQQAYALANMSEGKMGLDNIKKAITNASNDTKLEAILNNTLTDRRQVVQAVTAGNSDVAGAQAKWSDMLDEVDKVSPAQFSTESLKNSLDYVSNIYGLEGTSKASQIVRQIKADTAEPELSASQALNIRKGVNELIRKAPKGSREIGELEKVKSSLDSFIETTLPPETNKLVKDTTEEYARVINNKKFGDILTKNTSQGIGVDWSKVLTDSKKAGLSSPEVTISTNIAKAFEKKFRYDKQLSAVAAPKGIDEASGGLMFLLTQVANKVRDIASPVYNRTRYENLRIQKEIVKTIEKKGISITETLTGLAKNKNIPEEFRLGVFQKLNNYLGTNGKLAGVATAGVASGQSAEAGDIKSYFSKIESGGNYGAQNQFSGAYGKYQIHPVMMKELGISKAYLQKPENQEKVMDQLIPKYESRLEKFDIPVTKENMFVIHNLGSTGGVRVLTGKYTKGDISNMAKQLPEDLRGDDSTVLYNYSNKYNIQIPKRAT